METMLRRLSLLLALLIALAGCAAAEEVPNPRVEMADASELEAALRQGRADKDEIIEALARERLGLTYPDGTGKA